MGAYLSSPVTKKEQEAGANDWLRYGSTSMQGWRTNQEDAHNCIIDDDQNFGFFAVYDGHGGVEVASYAAQILPEILREQPLWKEGKFGEALQKTFLDFDKLILEENAINEMRRIRDKIEGTKPKKNANVDEDELFEEAVALSQEANMSVEELIAQYVGIRRKMMQRNEKRERNGEESEYGNKIKRAKMLKAEEDSASDDGKFSGDEVNGETDRAKDDVPDLDAKNAVKEDIKEDDNETETQSNHLPSQPTDTPMENGEVHSGASEPALPSDLDSSKSAVKMVVIEEKVETTILTIETTAETPDIPEEKRAARGKESGDATTPEVDESTPGSATAASSQLGVNSTQTTNSSDEEDDDYNAEDDEEEEDSTEESEEGESGDEDILLAMDGGGLEGSTPGVDSGTTACVVTLFKDRVVVANVGDSRAVLSRNGLALDLSVDHKPEDETERTRIEKAGGAISEDGRVNGGLNLSRALGDHYYKTNKAIPLEDQMISPKPDIVTQEITAADRFMVVACDGIWNSMSSQQVIDFVQERIEKKSLKEIGAEICDRCCATDTSGDGTGCDNMTVVIVDLRPKQPSKSQSNDEPPVDPEI